MKTKIISSATLHAYSWAIAIIFSCQSLLANPAGRGVGWGTVLTSPGIIVTNISARGDHSLALRNDGTIIAWGNAAFTQSSTENVVAVAAGGDASFSPQSNFGLGLTTNGTVLAWNGQGFYNQTPPAGLSNVVAISAGARHSLALKNDGTVVGWGDNSQQQLNFPLGLTNVVAISAGEVYSLALRNNGTAVASSIYHPVPGDATNLTAIAAGYSYGLGLKANGTVLLWSPSSGSSQLPNLTNAVAIAIGDEGSSYHVLALRSDGTVYTFGDNTYGQSTVPAGLSNVVAIAAGRHHSVALKNDGAVVCWGENTWGKTNFPTCVNDIVAVSAGAGYNLALKKDGTVSDWIGNQSLPAGLTNITAVRAGVGNGLALRNNGTVAAWGNNQFSQNNIPPTLHNVTAIALSEYHSFAVSNGMVVVWGIKSGAAPGAERVPANLNNVVAVSASPWIDNSNGGAASPGDFALALKNDGTVIGWGYNGSVATYNVGPTNVPAGLSNVVAIAAGGGHGLALQSDSTVMGWGYNHSGQATGIPNLISPYASTGLVVIAGQVLSNVVAISAGSIHSLALKNDGSVISWGYNIDGEATIPPGVSNVVAISAGFYQSLAIIADLRIDSINLAPQGPALNFHTFAGQQYSVEYSPDLISGSWSPLPNGNISGNGLDMQVIDTAGVDAASRFYRLRLLP